MVNVPKERRTFCKSAKCRKHTLHKVSQYKAGKASNFAQGRRRYDRKQQGYGGQTKREFAAAQHLACRFSGYHDHICSSFLLVPHLFRFFVSFIASAAVFKKKAKTTKKVTLRMECKECKYKMQLPLKRCKHFEIGANKPGGKKK